MIPFGMVLYSSSLPLLTSSSWCVYYFVPLLYFDQIDRVIQVISPYLNHRHHFVTRDHIMMSW